MPVIPTYRPIAGPFRSVHVPLEITWLPPTRPHLPFAVMFGGAEHYLPSRQRGAKQESGSGRGVGRSVQPLSAVSGPQTSIEVGLTAYNGCDRPVGTLPNHKGSAVVRQPPSPCMDRCMS